jgi:hypothetical protein
MRVKRWFAASASVSTAVVGIGLAVAPSAPADCRSVSGTMICDGGGGSPGQGPGSYATGTCDMGLDWYCDDPYGVDEVLDLHYGGNTGPSDDDGPSDRPRPTRPPRPRPHG